MYIFAAFPQIIPILMLIPVIIALYIDQKKIVQSVSKNMILLGTGFFVGGIVYFGLDYLIHDEPDIIQWSSLQISGIAVPVLFGALLLSYRRQQIKAFNFTRGGIGACIFFFLLSAIPFILLGWLAFYNKIIAATIFSFPVLFGIWLLLSVSKYTWRYFLAYVILALLSLIVCAFVLIGFSGQ